MSRSLCIALRSILLLGLSLPTTASRLVAQQGAPQDPAGAFATGRYRNLFAEQGHSPDEIQRRLEASFTQLFHGDRNTQAIYYEAGSNAQGPLAYITDVTHHDVRTEGMSYGMMIAVQMNHKQEFDELWNWASTFMHITDPTNPSVGYFAWSMNLDGTPRSDSPAPDGEEYFVMSLYFAANRWGSGKGIYDYKAHADRLLRLMRHHPVLSGTGRFRLQPDKLPFQIDPDAVPGSPATPARRRTVGPMVNEQNRMIVFVPNAGGDSFSDPSYHLPAFYELWARWGPPEDRQFWSEAAARSRHYFQQVTDPDTGLSPERAHFDGSPLNGPDNQPLPFSYDAWRTASNWAVDYSWWRSDPQEHVLSDRFQRFLLREGVDRFADRYTLSGRPLSRGHAAGMLAAAATSSLAATPGETSANLLGAFWSTPIPTGSGRYYDGMLYMLNLLHCSGNFRIFAPQ